jgi:hypothetical protein
MNGTQAKNVFWKVDGAVNLNNYTDFKGTIVANNGAINLTTGVTLLGRALTTNGAIGTAAIDVTLTAGCTGFAPNITTQPINKTLCASGSASFTVSSTGSGLSYQWHKGSTNLVNGGNISGATSATLLINPVTLADASINYNVIVSGAYAPADTSNYVSLSVSASPSITSVASNQLSCVNDLVKISVSATGGGLNYQWRRGTVNLSNVGNISGVNTPSLIFNPVTLINGTFNYNVVITGACSPSIISANNSLVVYESASISSQPQDRIACEGSTSLFNVAATGAGLNYQWRKGTMNLINGTNISGATTATLIISPVSLSDMGSDYNVVITGTCSPAITSNSVVLLKCNDVGIHSYSEAGAQSMLLYPNPFSTDLHIIVSDNGDSNEGVIQIYNVLGKEVLRSTLSHSHNVMATSELVSGIYLYTISFNNKVAQSGKIISQQ